VLAEPHRGSITEEPRRGLETEHGADPGSNGFMPYLLDDEHAAALWALSEQLVGEPFAI
jgi:hypothetical protein